MKKFLFLTLLVVIISTFAKAQIVRVDIDSLIDNSVSVFSKKWENSNDTVRIIEMKTQKVYGDSINGNVTIVLEWHLDTAKAVKRRENEILAAKKAKLRELEDEVEIFKKKNPEVKKNTKVNNLIMEEPPKQPAIKPKKQ